MYIYYIYKGRCIELYFCKKITWQRHLENLSKPCTKKLLKSNSKIVALDHHIIT